MKHIFFIHSHTLFLSSLGIINKLGIEAGDVLFLFSRHYRTVLPFDYQWIDISDEFENTFHILFSWSRKNFFYSRRKRCESLAFFDGLIEKYITGEYFLYSSQLQALPYQILATNSKCRECFFVQEGGRVMLSVLTDKISLPWRIYNYLVLRNDNRLWKCTNWFPNKHTPYNRPIRVYSFDDNYFGKLPKENIHIEWPTVNMDVEICSDYPIFLLEGAVELGQIEKSVYENAVYKLISQYGARNNYIKFHPMQSDTTKEKYKNMFFRYGYKIEELPMEIPFELILVKYKNLKLYGFGTSLLFYGKALGHDVISNEKELMKSYRYRRYAEKLNTL